MENQKEEQKRQKFSPAAGSKWCFLMGFVIKTIDSGEKSRPKGAKFFWALFGENCFVF